VIAVSTLIKKKAIAYPKLRKNAIACYPTIKNRGIDLYSEKLFPSKAIRATVCAFSAIVNFSALLNQAMNINFAYIQKLV
jgi:hypothetical protein